LKKKEDQKRKKIKNNLSSHTREPKIKKNSKLKWKPKDSRSKRRERSNASENFKKKLLIVKQKSMPFPVANSPWATPPLAVQPSRHIP
jgi:hypothetical protein